MLRGESQRGKKKEAHKPSVVGGDSPEPSTPRASADGKTRRGGEQTPLHSQQQKQQRMGSTRERPSLLRSSSSSATGVMHLKTPVPATPTAATPHAATATPSTHKKKRRKCTYIPFPPPVTVTSICEIANKAIPSWATFNAFKEKSATIVAVSPDGLVPRLTERQQMAILMRQLKQPTPHPVKTATPSEKKPCLETPVRRQEKPLKADAEDGEKNKSVKKVRLSAGSTSRAKHTLAEEKQVSETEEESEEEEAADSASEVAQESVHDSAASEESEQEQESNASAAEELEPSNVEPDQKAEDTSTAMDVETNEPDAEKTPHPFLVAELEYLERNVGPLLLLEAQRRQKELAVLMDSEHARKRTQVERSPEGSGMEVSAGDAMVHDSMEVDSARINNEPPSDTEPDRVEPGYDSTLEASMTINDEQKKPDIPVTEDADVVPVQTTTSNTPKLVSPPSPEPQQLTISIQEDPAPKKANVSEDAANKVVASEAEQPTSTAPKTSSSIPWLIRNQLLRQQTSFDFNFRRALKLLRQQDVDETQNMWGELPNQSERLAKWERTVHSVRYMPSPRDHSVLLPGWPKLLAKLQQRQMNAVRMFQNRNLEGKERENVWRALMGELCPRREEVAAVEEEQLRLLESHVERWFAFQQDAHEQHLRFLFAFKQEVDRVCKTPLFFPRKQVGNASSSGKLRTMALQQLSVYLMDRVQTWDLQQTTMCEELEEQAGALLAGFKQDWRHQWMTLLKKNYDCDTVPPHILSTLPSHLRKVMDEQGFCVLAPPGEAGIFKPSMALGNELGGTYVRRISESLVFVDIPEQLFSADPWQSMPSSVELTDVFHA